jgi:pyridoxine 4-dehydrogenase
VTVEQIDEALAIAPVVAVQNRYSIDSRRPGADDVLRACAERGIAFVPFFAIAGEGRDGGKRTTELKQSGALRLTDEDLALLGSP